MNCHDELTLSIYADGELPSEQAEQVTNHLQSCAACRQLVEQLSGENEMLGDLIKDTQGLALPATAPAFATLQVLSLPFIALLMTAPILGAAYLSALDGPLFRSMSLSGLLAATAFLMDQLFAKGPAMLSFLYTIAGFVMAGGTLYFSLTSPRLRGAVLGSVAMLLATFGATGTVDAADLRGGDTVVVDENEELLNGLVAHGDTVRVLGVIDGDLVVAARHLVVQGTVKGSIYAAAEDIDLTGTVFGNVHAAGKNINISGTLQGSSYTLSQTVRISSMGSIARDARLIAQELYLEGALGSDLQAAGQKINIKGPVKRNLQVAAEEVFLGPKTSIGGDIFAMLPSEDALHRSPNAVVGGQTQIEVNADMQGMEEEKGLGIGSIVFDIFADIFAGLLVALLIILLVPKLIPAMPTNKAEVASRMGYGLVTLLTLPVISFFLLITFVGIPVSLIIMGCYFLGCYLATLVVAIGLGRRMLNPKPGNVRGFMLATLAGLAVIEVFTHIPVVGVGISFVVLLLGLGSLSNRLIVLWKGEALVK